MFDIRQSKEEIIAAADRLYAENARLRAALDKAAYALFQIKRMTPDAVRQFASDAHVAACESLNHEQSKDAKNG